MVCFRKLKRIMFPYEMKLMRWVEVHIGRSRRKSKKSKDGVTDSPSGTSSASPCPIGKTRLHDLSLDGSLRVPSPWSSGDMATSSPNLSATLYRWKKGDDTQELDDSLLDSLETEELDNRPKPPKVVCEPSTINNNVEVIADKETPAPIHLVPGSPSLATETNLNHANCPKRPPLHIRTSFQESSAQETGSPRQRSRIKTNPWIPSPRSSCSSTSGDSGWSGTRSSGSDSPETAEGFGSGSSVFGSQSSGTPWGGWSSVTSLRSNRETGTTCQLPSRSRDKLIFDPRRVTSLERKSKGYLPWVDKDVDQLLLLGADRILDTNARQRRGHGVTHIRNDPRSRSLPRVEWEFLPDSKTVCPLAEGDSSEPDEAYSEDFVQSEDPEDELGRGTKNYCPTKEATSPQADSACSCSTTPLSEVEPPRNVTPESLDEKVRRLRSEQRRVGEKMREAREDEQRRREERLVCQQELIHFRRLLLLKTLQDLRSRLELQGERLHRAYSATLEMKHDWHEETWPAYD